MTSRRHRERTSSTKKDDTQQWFPSEFDSERTRQTMSNSQRHNVDPTIANPGHDKHHRSSRRTADVPRDISASSAPYPEHKSSRKDHLQYVAPSSAHAYYSMGDQNALSQPSSHPANGTLQTRESDPYDGRAYVKSHKKASKRSPPSSDEKALATEQAKAAYPNYDSRHGRIPSASAAPQPPSTTQTFWIPPTEHVRDPRPSSRHRDRDREEDKERRRDKERRKEEKEKERELEKRRIQEEEVARQQEKERERERRREERRREKERAEQQQYDAERERRRLERRARKAKEEEARRQYDLRVADASVPNPSKNRTHRTEERALSRQPHSEQIPSSSNNVPPVTQHTAVTHAGSRAQPNGNVHAGDIPVANYARERERRAHRSHRDRTQQNQESGMSSSEQEHSGRERGVRASDRKYTTRDQYDSNPSGPSGSENERTGRERRTHRRPPANDSHAEPSTRAADAIAHANAQVVGQTTIPVGHATFARHVSHVVSIRAGQGPADPQTPMLPASGHTPSAALPSEVQANGSTSHMPAGLVRSSSIPQSAYLHPSAALARTQQAHMALSSHPQHSHGSSSAPPQRNETQDALPNGHAEAPSVRPPSVAPVSQYTQPRPPAHTANSNSAQQPISHTKQNGKTSPTQAARLLNAKTDVTHGSMNAQPGHIAKVSVYHSPDPPVSADLYVLNPKYAAHSDGVSSQQYQPPQHDSTPSNHLSSQRPEPSPGEDTPRAAPLPIPGPRSLYSSMPGPAPDQSPAPLHDPRSPKQNMPTAPQALSASPWQSSRSQIPPAQVKSTTLPNGTPAHESTSVAVDNIHGHSHPQPSSRAPQLPSSQALPVNGSTSSYSPRDKQLSNLRSAPTTGTPRQSPSGRLNPRNGSNDTITLPNASKVSPSSASYRPLNQSQVNGVNVQSHAQSRQDITNQMNARGQATTSGYPDNARYRSHTPSSSYPLANPSSSQQQQVSSNVLSSSSVNQHQTNYAPSVSQQTYSYSRNLVPSNTFATDNSTRNYGEPASHATTQDFSQRHQPAAAPSVLSSAPVQSSAAAIAAAYRSGTYHQESGTRPSEPASAPPTQTSYRIPPRAAPSPAPSVRQYPAMPATSASRSAYPNIAAPTPVRGQTHPAPGAGTLGAGRAAATPAPPYTHSRTVSDQTTSFRDRVAVAGHLSTPAPTKAQLSAIQIPSPAPEPEQLRTPSSLAPSMLQRGNSYGSLIAPPSVAPSKDTAKEKERRKRGFLGLFRSRSSPPKEGDVRPATMPKESKTRPRTNSQSTMTGIAASVRNIVTPHPHHQPRPVQQQRAQDVRSEQMSQSAPSTKTVFQQPPVVAPKPVLADHRNANGKMFTPFRLLSKRHRTVSAASVEAQDGTATNTVVDSTRSSTAGRPSPPLRDPTLATMDWRDRGEAEQSVRKNARRHRPGVTFETFPDPNTKNVQQDWARAPQRPNYER